jgi:hypothetical protein
MTAFFIPGVADGARAVEEAYSDMRRLVEVDLGKPPTSRRIVKIWTRRGSTDCMTEVGMSDPVSGGTVMAIFDMGPHQPFVIWHQPNPEMRDGIREVVGCNAYAVDEFDT